MITSNRLCHADLDIEIAASVCSWRHRNAHAIELVNRAVSRVGSYSDFHVRAAHRKDKLATPGRHCRINWNRAIEIIAFSLKCLSNHSGKSDYVCRLTF